MVDSSTPSREIGKLPIPENMNELGNWEKNNKNPENNL